MLQYYAETYPSLTSQGTLLKLSLTSSISGFRILLIFLNASKLHLWHVTWTDSDKAVSEITDPVLADSCCEPWGTDPRWESIWDGHRPTSSWNETLEPPDNWRRCFGCNTKDDCLEVGPPFIPWREALESFLDVGWLISITSSPKERYNFESSDKGLSWAVVSQLDCQPLNGKGTDPLDVFCIDEEEKVPMRLWCSEHRGGCLMWCSGVSIGMEVFSSSDSLGLSSQEWKSSAVSSSIEVSLGYDKGVHSLRVSELSIRWERIEPLIVEIMELSRERDELSLEWCDFWDISCIWDIKDSSSEVDGPSSFSFFDEAGIIEEDEEEEEEEDDEEVEVLSSYLSSSLSSNLSSKYMFWCIPILLDLLLPELPLPVSHKPKLFSINLEKSMNKLKVNWHRLFLKVICTTRYHFLKYGIVHNFLDKGTYSNYVKILLAYAKAFLLKKNESQNLNFLNTKYSSEQLQLKFDSYLWKNITNNSARS